MGTANAPQFLRRASLWFLNDGRTTMTDGPSQHKAVLHIIVYDTICVKRSQWRSPHGLCYGNGML